MHMLNLKTKPKRVTQHKYELEWPIEETASGMFDEDTYIPWPISQRLYKSENPIELTEVSDFESIDWDVEPTLKDHHLSGTVKRAARSRSKREKMRSYRRSIDYFKKLGRMNPRELTPRQIELMNRNRNYGARLERTQSTTSGQVEELQLVAATCSPSGSVDRPSTSGLTHRDDWDRKSATSMAAKRARSSEECLKNTLKRIKPSVSFNSQADLQVAIVDKSDPDGKITSSNWLLVEAELLAEMIKDERSDEEVDFDSAGWQNGVKVISCGNKKSLDLLTEVISNCGELWPNAKLEILPRSLLPLRPMVTVWIPPPVPESGGSVQKLIAKQNPYLEAECWKFNSATAPSTGLGMDYRFRVSHQSLEMLRAARGIIRFGFGSLKARLPNEGNTMNQDKSGSGTAYFSAPESSYQRPASVHSSAICGWGPNSMFQD